MPLSILTDEQISPRVAEQIVAHRADIHIESVHRWRDGDLMGAADEVLLRAAATDGLTLVTFDLATIPALLTALAQIGEHHSRVIFVDRRTVAQHDIGGLVRALIDEWDRTNGLDWTDRVAF